MQSFVNLKHLALSLFLSIGIAYFVGNIKPTFIIFSLHQKYLSQNNLYIQKLNKYLSREIYWVICWVIKGIPRDNQKFPENSNINIMEGCSPRILSIISFQLILLSDELLTTGKKEGWINISVSRVTIIRVD